MAFLFAKGPDLEADERDRLAAEIDAKVQSISLAVNARTLLRCRAGGRGASVWAEDQNTTRGITEVCCSLPRRWRQVRELGCAYRTINDLGEQLEELEKARATSIKEWKLSEEQHAQQAAAHGAALASLEAARKAEVCDCERNPPAVPSLLLLRWSALERALPCQMP